MTGIRTRDAEEKKERESEKCETTDVRRHGKIHATAIKVSGCIYHITRLQKGYNRGRRLTNRLR